MFGNLSVNILKYSPRRPVPPAQLRAPLPHCCVLQAHFWGMYQSEAVVPGSALQGQKLNPVLVPSCAPVLPPLSPVVMWGVGSSVLALAGHLGLSTPSCGLTRLMFPCLGYCKQCCNEYCRGTHVSFNSGFLGVYAQQWDCWVLWQFYFQFFKIGRASCRERV